MMRGFAAFLRKECAEVLRTWRVFVLPGLVLFFAASGPLLAKLTPALVRTLTAEQQPGLVIQVPEATYVDAYLQWAKNLSQIVLIAAIIIFAGLISSEKRAGTAVLVLTKPVSRTAFVVAKFASASVQLAVPVALGALVTRQVTLLVFDEAPLLPMIRATGAWLAFGVLIVALMELLSALFDSQAGAAGVGIAAYALIGVAGMWGPAARYSPAGLVGAVDGLIKGSEAFAAWPVVSALAVAVCLVAAAAAVFRAREL
jgi:ABC-2 type transport system permease protein